MDDVLSKINVVIIGAGPSGAVAAGLLVKKGYQVLVLEKQTFPRFSIGESLLPQCMKYIEESGFMDAVQSAGFQHKNGAAFQRRGKHETFSFEEKFTPGWGTTFQVERSSFDKILIDEAEKSGANVRYQCEVISVNIDETEGNPSVEYQSEDGTLHTVECQFILDASGFGRVLPRLLDLEEPSHLPVRRSVFTHITDGINDASYDRDKILITVHPKDEKTWYWLIPFSNGRSSIGVVAEPEWFERYNGSHLEMLQIAISQDPHLAKLLKNASFDFPVQQASGYSCNVKKLCGKNFALLGNAGEFLDPVFSSGVTIAMHSASLAVLAVDKQLKGLNVDWDKDYVKPLYLGIDTFRTFVDAWYDGSLQDIIFSDARNTSITEMISSILAGYAWDETNPYVAKSRRRIEALAQICKEGADH